MKRVGILTLYYKTYNFGAQLQACSLQKTIEELGYECEQIRFIWSKEETIYNYANASINQKAFVKFSNSIRHSEKIYDVSNISECLKDYDVFVVGSDQIWGVENSMPLMNLPVMTLSFVTDDKVKVAYAASFGSTAPSSRIEEILRGELHNFDAVSVREKTAEEYLTEMTDNKIETVLDPVFLRERTEWENLSNLTKEKNQYIFYYTVSANSRQDAIVEGVSNSFGYEIRRLGYISGEQIGPEEFIEWIKNAEYVVTDSFHASVLSVLFHKQFVVLPVDHVPTNRSRNARLQNMLELFQLNDRYVEYVQDVTGIVKQITVKLMEEIPYHLIDIILEENRKKSIDFLKQALSIEKEKDEFLAAHDKCTGCGVCYLTCPVNAIEMKRDKLGFVYPIRDRDKCIECGKCREVCTYKSNPIYDNRIIGLQSKDAVVRRNSSAGGVFYELASYILKKDGIVVGCKYNADFEVVHDFCMSAEDLDAFCRSKYVQSNAYMLFPKVKQYLDEGKIVMFVGTPCQTTALVAFLGIVPENLYLIDLICGGVGAPGLWNKYLNYINAQETVESITMRHKYTEYLKPEGFPAFSMKVDFSENSKVYEGAEDLYLRSRLSFYRNSCYSCQYKGDKRESDITIGDFVGMNQLLKNQYDGYGTTLTIIHTAKGRQLLEKCNNAFLYVEIPDEMQQEILAHNVMLSENMKRKAQHYYMRAIYEKSSIERLFYEDKLWDEFHEKEVLLKSFFNEVKRNDLLVKTERFISYRLWLDDDPNVYGDVFIYGAGKLGRSLLKCTRSVEGFIDGNINLNTCEGVKVYHLGTEEIKKCIDSGKEVTVIITPVWDYDILQDKLQKEFPEINIISAESLVGNIWI